MYVSVFKYNVKLLKYDVKETRGGLCLVESSHLITCYEQLNSFGQTFGVFGCITLIDNRLKDIWHLDYNLSLPCVYFGTQKSQTTNQRVCQL